MRLEERVRRSLARNRNIVMFNFDWGNLPITVNVSLSDVLQDRVEEKYFLSENMTQRLMKTGQLLEHSRGAVVRTFQGGGHSGGLHSQMTAIISAKNPREKGNKRYEFSQESPSITSKSGHQQRTLIKIGNIAESGHDSLWGRVYDPEGIAMNLNAEGGGVGAKTGLYMVGRIGKDSQASRVYSPEGVSPTLSSGNRADSQGQAYSPKIIDTKRNVDGKPQVYTPNSPALASTDYKEPLKVMIVADRTRTTIPLRWTRSEKGKEARRLAKKEEGRDYTPFTEGHRQFEPSREDVSGCVTNALNKDSLLGQLPMTVANTVTPDAYLARGARKRVNGKAVLTSMHERRIRRLTPVECERLQAFPDGWTKLGLAETQGEADKANRRHVSAAVRSKFPKGNPFYGPILRKFWERGMKTLDPCVFHVSDTQRYRTLGNAITVSVVTFLGRRIRENCF